MVYDISDNQSTTMAKSKELFNSCRATNNKPEELTENDFRKNVDLAWRITTEFAAKSKKPNVIEPVMTSDHPPCECGSTNFQRTGTCHICMTCFTSQGCS